MLNKKIAGLLILLVFFLRNPAQVYAADSTPPVTTLISEPSFPNGENGWYTSFPIINITAIDAETGVREINWKINDGDWQTALYTEGLNLILNYSFENGYINNWNFVNSIFTIGYKSSFLRRTGRYAAGIINLNLSASPHWRNDMYLEAVPLETYNYSFYMASITSFLDNGFYEIVSVDPEGNETVLASQYDIDLKLNYKNFSGNFTSTSITGSNIILKIGIEGLGHLSIDDVDISLAGEDTLVEFSLDQEGENNIWYYSKDGAGNIEQTNQANFNVDVLSPSFSNFETYDIDSIHKFASRIDVSDNVSGLVSDPTLFNYSVDGFTNGYYSDYASCSGNFVEEDYMVISNDYTDGANNGNIWTPIIDYCDANWINCKRLNFYVKDLAGNIGDHSICVNGPYISTVYGDVFGRNSIWNMGIGDSDNIWGIAVSSGSISDVTITSGFSTANYEHDYLNNIYAIYSDLLSEKVSVVTDIPPTEGVYSIQSDYALSSELFYTDVSQVVFISGDLTISQNIISTNSEIFYIVNGTVVVSNDVTQVDVFLLSTNEIYTAENFDLSTALTVNGGLIAQNINFNRNTDRTLGSSEIINLPLSSFIKNNYLSRPILYWKEIQK